MELAVSYATLFWGGKSKSFCQYFGLETLGDPCVNTLGGVVPVNK